MQHLGIGARLSIGICQRIGFVLAVWLLAIAPRSAGEDKPAANAPASITPTAATPAPASGNSSAPTASPADSTPVIDDGSGWIVIDRPIALHAPGLATWYEKSMAQPIEIFIEGTEMSGAEIWVNKLRDDWLTIYLRRDPTNQHSRDAWNRILCTPKGLLGRIQKLHATVGRAGELPLASRVTLPLMVVPGGWFIGWAVLMCALLAALMVMGKRTELLRDSGPQPEGGRKPYSLARTQMAFWFFATVAAFLFIFLVTGDTDTLTPEVLALMGISAGTGFGAVLMDASKRSSLEDQLSAAELARASLHDAQPQQPEPPLLERTVEQLKVQQADETIRQLRAALVPSQSCGFWHDLVSDGDGVSFHRLQIVVWTLVVGVIFTSSVYSALAMPQLSSTLLGLMGLSGGTYLGFKLPEKLN